MSTSTDEVTYWDSAWNKVESPADAHHIVAQRGADRVSAVVERLPKVTYGDASVAADSYEFELTSDASDEVRGLLSKLAGLAVGGNGISKLTHSPATAVLVSA